MEITTGSTRKPRPRATKASAPKIAKPRSKKVTTVPSVAEPVPAAKRVTKLSEAIGLMRRTEGANVGELMATTGWQAHSVRGAIAGAIKKKLRLAVSTEKVEGRGTVYLIAPSAE
jgi:hypothetical protein